MASPPKVSAPSKHIALPDRMSVDLLCRALDVLPISVALLEVNGGGSEVLYANAAAQRRLNVATLDTVAVPAGFRQFTLPAQEGGEARILLVEAELAVSERVERCARAWRLSMRQAQVLEHLVAGESNKGIASLLDISDSTVELHVRALFAKVGVDARSAILAEFWKTGRG